MSSGLVLAACAGSASIQVTAECRTKEEGICFCVNGSFIQDLKHLETRKQRRFVFSHENSGVAKNLFCAKSVVLLWEC